MKKLLLYLFYNFVKNIVEISYFIYFDKVTFINGDVMRKGHPCIIASNHPNCLVDVFLVCKKSNRIVHFLANSSLFKPPFWEWFFNTFYAIPIQRLMDTGGKPLKNADAFNKCDEFLIDGGALFIAPQGTSWLERRLGKIKTGTARIALSAAAKQNFDTELEIIPAGVTYKDALAFRKSALIQIGTPIKISKYKAAYEEHPRTAAMKLTEELTEAMSALVIDAETIERDDLLKKHEEILNGKTPLPLSKEFFRTEKVLAGLNKLESENPKGFDALETNTNEYYETLTANKINDQAVVNHAESSIVKILLLIIGFPFFLFGAINNLLAWGIPVLIKNNIKIYPGFYSTIKIMAGIVTTPIFYGLQIFLVNKFFQNPIITWSYALLLIPMGVFAWWYYNNFDDIRKSFKLSRDKVLAENLTEKRKKLSAVVESLLE